VTPQKRAGIGQQIQSLLSYPLRPIVSLPPTEINSLRPNAKLGQNYQALKYQLAKAGKAGTILLFSRLKNYAEILKTAWPRLSLHHVGGGLC